MTVSISIPLLSRFTCRFSSIPAVITKFNQQNMRPILANINENPTQSNSNFREIKKLIRTYPGNYIAFKLSALNIKDYSNAFDMSYEICELGRENRCTLIIDAEYQSIQDSINSVSDKLMSVFNIEDVLLYKTYQCYRKDIIKTIEHDLNKPRDYKLGMKFVRGAYYDDEKDTGYLCDTKEYTDHNYNSAIEMFVEYNSKNSVHPDNRNHLICATHNEESIEKAIKTGDTNIMYAQLMGMSDNLSHTLVKKNQNVFKYVPYGDTQDTFPYLMRRLYENFDFMKYYFM